MLTKSCPEGSLQQLGFCKAFLYGSVNLMIDEFILQKLLKTSANPKAAKKKKKAAEKVLEKFCFQ